MQTRDLVDAFQIEQTLFRFMQAFDDKDWSLMRACLEDSVDCDYSALRGTPPQRIDAATYVEQRRSALSQLAMQHNLSNLQVSVHGDRAGVRCNFAVLRFHPSWQGEGPGFFHSYGHYRFGLTRTSSDWRIHEIVQVVTANEGNPAIHAGAHARAESPAR